VTLFSDDRGNSAPGEADDQEGEHPTVSESERRASRRRTLGLTLIVVAFVLLLVMLASPAPYVIDQPGPVFNTLGSDQPVGQATSATAKVEPLITIDGHVTYPTKGGLYMLTVSQLGDPDQLPNWGQVISAWFSPSSEVIPVSVAYPPGQGVQQQNAENAELMTSSQQDAVAAALNQLGYRFSQRVMVAQVVDGPSKDILKVGDQVTAVDGVTVKGVQSLHEQLAMSGAGKPAVVTIIRNGVQQNVTITPEETAGAVIIGIGVTMQYEFPFKVTIQLSDVGGPSAGQMFALGIMDKLTSGHLNGGASVAGTGTIDNEGDIGAIGGIRQKMFGARAAGATVFLAPASNCDEVTGHIPAGLHVYAVKTLSDSLKVLDAVRTGSSMAALPTCPTS
jgi:PDZ domain-containing protein